MGVAHLPMFRVAHNQLTPILAFPHLEGRGERRREKVAVQLFARRVAKLADRDKGRRSQPDLPHLRTQGRLMLPKAGSSGSNTTIAVQSVCRLAQDTPWTQELRIPPRY